MVLDPDRVTRDVEPGRAAQDGADTAPTVPHPRESADREPPAPDPAAGEPAAISGDPPQPAADGPATPTRHRPWPSARQQIGTGVAVLGWATAAFLVGHRFLPNAAGLAALLENALPWLAIPAVLLLLVALAVRSPRALIAAGAAVALWGGNFGPQLLPRGSDLPADLRVLSEDVNASTAELAATGTLAAAQHADVVALQDVYPRLAASSAVDGLDAAYQYHVTQYEFGLWSRYPITGTTAVDLELPADQANAEDSLAVDAPHLVVGALRVVLSTAKGELVLYVVHLPPPSLGDQGFAKVRDAAVDRFVGVVAADHAPLLAVVGSLNVAATDRGFTALTKRLGLASAQAAAGRGFGFTWPAEFPAVRLDDLLARGATAVRSVVLPELAGGKSHLPIEVDLHL